MLPLEWKASPVNPAMITMARLACGKTQSEFADILGIPQARLSRIEDWFTGGIDAALVTKCSQVTGYPEEFFMREGGQKPLPEVFFRRQSGTSAKAQKRAEALINVKRLEIEKLLATAEIEPVLPLPQWAADEFDGGPREIARQLRCAWGIPRGPIHNMTKIVEDTGCIVIPFDFGTPKIDGVSTTTSNAMPLIYVNPRSPTARYRLTLAHELGHAIMHRLPTPMMEDEAFEFAAEFLVPEEEIRPDFFPLDLEKLSRLKLKWGVSMQALLRWAKQTGSIKDSYYKFLSMSISRAGWKTVEPYDLETPPEKPTLLQRLVGVHLNDLHYSPDDLQKMLAANHRTFAAEYLGNKKGAA